MSETTPEEKSRPILFSAPMIRALLAGTKTQTRRIVKLPEPTEHPWRMEPPFCVGEPPVFVRANRVVMGHEVVSEYLEPRCPYGKPGDRLWVKETWAPVSAYDGTDPGSAALAAGAFYRADHPTGVWSEKDPTKPAFKWRPSIHMPRRASRITLEIVAVRAQRLQVISERDCCAEGCGSPITRDCKKPKFRELWESINGAGSWDANPWVWAIEFKRVAA